MAESWGADTLIPSSIADPRSQALAALTSRLGNLDPAVAITLLIDHVSASALPHLVRQFDMADWVTDTMAEVTIRRLLKQAVALKRRMGTRWAVAYALSAAGAIARITEWWEAEPQAEPHTFAVDLLVNEHLRDDALIISPALVKDARRLIDVSKRASQHYTIRLGAALDQPIRLGSNVTGRVGLNRRLDARLPHPIGHTRMTTALRPVVRPRLMLSHGLTIEGRTRHAATSRPIAALRIRFAL